MTTHKSVDQLRRASLDSQFESLKKCSIERPSKGWISELRRLFGIRSEQLARKIGITQSALSRLEESERNDSITLGSLKRAAEALNCDLNYVLVPREPMEDQLLDRALAVVQQDENALRGLIEKESVDDDSHSKNALKRLSDAYKLIEKRDRRIWD